jgi:hypothetical protein
VQRIGVLVVAMNRADSESCVSAAATPISADDRPLSRSTAVRVGGTYGQLLALPDLGLLTLADTVYLTQEGLKTIGLLWGSDRSARTCLLTLDLRPSDGAAVAWSATVERVTWDGTHSRNGVGESFLFYPRQRIGE